MSVDLNANDDEKLSPQEAVARELERWQKEYYDKVHAAYLRQDQYGGEIAFEAWEEMFLVFLESVSHRLRTWYRKTVESRSMRRVFGDTISESWLISKGSSVEAFLTYAIDQVRAGHGSLEFAGAIFTIPPRNRGNEKIFIGHGRSHLWRELKDFLKERLHLKWDEFNREPTAGFTTVERLEKMLGEASFAFLVMTAEDEHSDMKLHARQNVIHEVGLFQGKLGFKKAIILLEDGCERFSNIEGLTYIPFPKGNIEAAFERIRGVLEREGIVK